MSTSFFFSEELHFLLDVSLHKRGPPLPSKNESWFLWVNKELSFLVYYFKTRHCVGSKHTPVWTSIHDMNPAMSRTPKSQILGKARLSSGLSVNVDIVRRRLSTIASSSWVPAAWENSPTETPIPHQRSVSPLPHSVRYNKHIAYLGCRCVSIKGHDPREPSFSVCVSVFPSFSIAPI